MNMKSIKNLIKVIMISGIVVMFNIGNVVNCFASENVMTMDNFYNKYGIVNNGAVDNSIKIYAINTKNNNDGTLVTNFCNGSWYSVNNITNKYVFKPIESDKEISFSDEFALCTSTQEYQDIKLQLKQVSKFIKSINIIGIGSHSDKIYTDDLSTDEKLTHYANQWLKDNYNMILDIPINYSTLKDDTQGVFINKGEIAQCIQINDNFKNIDMASEKAIIHELTHMALFIQGKEFLDVTDTFKEECVKNGGNTNDGSFGILHSHLKCTM